MKSPSRKKPERPFEWADKLLNFWDEIRKVRNMSAGSLEESEALLDEIESCCVTLTGAEYFQRLLNTKEREAKERIQEWIDSLEFSDISEDEESTRISDEVELWELYEEWRAVVAIGDRTKIKHWIQHQTFAVRFMIKSIFVERPAGR